MSSLNAYPIIYVSGKIAKYFNSLDIAYVAGALLSMGTEKRKGWSELQLDKLSEILFMDKEKLRNAIEKLEEHKVIVIKRIPVSNMFSYQVDQDRFDSILMGWGCD